MMLTPAAISGKIITHRMDSRIVEHLVALKSISPAERRNQVGRKLNEMLERAEREELTGDVSVTCNFRRGRMIAFNPEYPEREYFGD